LAKGHGTVSTKRWSKAAQREVVSSSAVGDSQVDNVHKTMVEGNTASSRVEFDSAMVESQVNSADKAMVEANAA
jgi:hypothetical protein